MLKEWLSDVTYRLRAIFRRERVEHELDEELRFHLEREAEKHMKAGMSRDEAMRRARIEFGGVDRIKEDVRDTRGVSWIETVARDLRYAFRGLRRKPAFTAAVILTLGL